MREGGSGRRFFQEGRPINFEGFPASAGTASDQKDEAFPPETAFPRIKGPRGESECIRRATEACKRRTACCSSTASFSRACGKSKGRYALWDSGPRPQRHGDQSLFSTGKLCRCQRVCSRNRSERSVHRKDFPGPVNPFGRRRGVHQQ